MLKPAVLALDQGTTSSRAIVFGREGLPLSTSQLEFAQIYPRPGDVEHDPEAIWTTQLQTAREAITRVAFAEAGNQGGYTRDFSGQQASPGTAGGTAGGEGACSGKSRKSKDGSASHRPGYHCGMRH